ncbi:MAG TPA: xanthine dehydrogenase family protein molybdopterin-binding subunit [Dehalococcoidia bacterium]|nr:xanthine dehydrogenase family protein molybdopterin-binding subunit [Dehalococcoidia bacterium]
MAYSVVGKPLPRVDAPTKATGQAKFAADLSLPGMLTGKILRSPYPHARIVNIDTSRAARLAGVKAILTGQEIPRVKYGFTFRFPQFCDEYLLAIDKARYLGEGLAAVAAVDGDAASEALELIRVEYEELPHVLEPEAAMAPGAPQIHDTAENNVGVRMSHDFGDVDAGFRDADYIREDRFLLQAQAHAPIEPHAVLAEADPSGRLTVWGAKQSPFRARYGLSRTLDRPEGTIRVIRPTLGGGFGGKGEMMCLDFCASALALRSGRPVRIAYTREESLCTTRARHPMVVHLKTGVKKDGTLTAQSCRVIADGGAYMSTGAVALYLAASHLNLPYRLSNYRVEGFRVYTNKQPSGAMRGHGTPQPRFAMECQLDMIAEELGLDPLELRLRNAIEGGYRAPNGYLVPSCGYKETLRRAAQASGWEEARGEKTPGRGIGLAGYTFLSGSTSHLWDTKGAMSSAIVSLQENGTVHLVTGASDIGQGTDTALSQIAAEELGVRLEDVRITAADTELCPLDWGTGGSRVTFQSGNAVRWAAQEARKPVLEAAADHLEARPDDLELRDRMVYVKGSPEKGMGLSEAIALAMTRANGAPVIGRGSFDQTPTLPDFRTGVGNLSFAYVFGAQIAQVAVDRETGKVDAEKMAVFHDCGFAINPLSVQGQIDGSSIMGAGYALAEELERRDGTTMNPSLLDYRMPTSLDACEVLGGLVESMDPGGPYGAKEAGEGLMVGAAPAIANAVYDAIGVRINELPITPEKVLRAIEGRAARE